ncbi:MAG: c-type cytochrome [Rhodocyclaceae bacterium]
MKRAAGIVASAAVLLCAVWTQAHAAPAAKAADWGKLTAEAVATLKLQGDVERGREAYRQCRGCHRADGMGRIDGTYPKLAGQHASVIIKQVTDVRSGLRLNPKMVPFAEHDALTLQELRDIAEFLQQLEPLRENGKGPGQNVDRGKAVYEGKKCDKCHGRNGEGDEARFYPVVAAQHYDYLEREMRLIKKRRRGNSHPDMVKVIKPLSDDDLEAVADYLSRLPDWRTASKKEAK